MANAVCLQTLNISTLVAQKLHQVAFEMRIADRQPQDFALPQIERLFRWESRAVERNAHGKLAAEARFRINRDIPVHQVDQLLADGQPQPGSLKMTLHTGSDLEEWVRSEERRVGKECR